MSHYEKHDKFLDEEILVKRRDYIDLIQCYYRTRDSDDMSILGRSDAIVDNIKEKYKKRYKE